MSYRRRLNLVTRVVDGETLLFDPAAGTLHRLNVTAGHIWSECDRQTAPEMTTHLAQQCDAAPQVVLTDVLITLAEFRRLGLLELTATIKERDGVNDDDRGTRSF